MKTFRTLEIAKEFYQLTHKLRMSSHLKEQFLRSASSVALNLAEGNAKMSAREKLRFYEIAHGSFREAVVILDLEEVREEKVRSVTDKLGASLYRLTRAMATQLATSSAPSKNPKHPQ